MTINLMTTLGCHLCDEALQIFNDLLAENPALFKRFEIHLVEIADSEHLIESYGIRIPVLQYDEQELAWIFSMDDLSQWLQSL
ncbi:MAG: thioredoxin family protein [Kangiella sp.]|nr:MAG: thioredoxin family protein [Kangiella sp.]